MEKVKRGLSAGRVQSVALRLIVDRERERQAFVSEEYWSFKIRVQGTTPPAFEADLWKVDGLKPSIGNAPAALALEERLTGCPYLVSDIAEKERLRHPRPPFITSTLQQEASTRLGFNAKRTMSVAQRLYEGVELGQHGTTALITYMRTDSVRISDEARDAARSWISTVLGQEFYPEKPRVFKSKGSAQDAHEAIRPVDPSLTPDSVKASLPPEQYKLYRLIWERFMASQMASARFWDTVITIESGPALWRAKGERLVFPGFLSIQPQAGESDAPGLPKLLRGQELHLQQLHKEQKFTQPPARFSEASLVHKLEELGIGRPSTYAAIISTLTERDYVQVQDKHFLPTDLGIIVCDLLVEHFSQLMDAGFTARMEENLDRVAEGGINWIELLQNFAQDFYPALDKARETMAQVKSGMDTGLTCPQCNRARLVVKFGKNGTFLGCADYPTCSFTSNYTRNDQGEIRITLEPVPEDLGPCTKCQNGRMVVKKTKTGGRFIACSNYPQCRNSKSMALAWPAPARAAEENWWRRPAAGENFSTPAATTPNVTMRSGTSPWHDHAPFVTPKFLSAGRQRSEDYIWPALPRTADSGKSSTRRAPFQTNPVFFQKCDWIVTEFGLAQSFVSQVLLTIDGLESLAALLQENLVDCLIDPFEQWAAFLEMNDNAAFVQGLGNGVGNHFILHHQPPANQSAQSRPVLHDLDDGPVFGLQGLIVFRVAPQKPIGL